jgi:hypothetical protein
MCSSPTNPDGVTRFLMQCFFILAQALINPSPTFNIFSQIYVDYLQLRKYSHLQVHHQWQQWHWWKIDHQRFWHR